MINLSRFYAATAEMAYPTAAVACCFEACIANNSIAWQNGLAGGATSRYYVDPSVEGATGNELLTFDVVYRRVPPTYYILYSAMNQVFALNSEKAVTPMAKGILQRTEKSLWLTTDYMPRTRDMSESRRGLLRAWCRKVAG